jgi:hypothetical protein
MGLLIWLLCGSSIYRLAMGIPAIAGNPFISTILKILSLSSWLSDIVNWISGLLVQLFALIIF